MRVSTLLLKGFTRHTNTQVDLPEVGIVVVSGLNGSGKSSLVEAPAVAGWGQSLRGTSPWQDGREGVVEVVASEACIRRGRGKAVGSLASGKPFLEWSVPGQLAVTYESTTKAQEALEAIIGSFDVWRRTCVFSSQDAAHFTLSTDAERKRLLESILALGKFDAALERCRTAKRVAEASLSAAQGTVATLKARMEAERGRVSDAESTVKGLPPEVDVTAAETEVARLTALVRECDAETVRLSESQRSVDRAVAQAEAVATESERRRLALDKANCDRCGQAIPTALVAPLRKAVAKDRKAVDAARQAAEEVQSSVTGQLLEISDERGVFAQKLADLQAKVRQAGVVKEQWKRARALLKSAEEGVATLGTRIAAGDEALVVADAEVRLLEAVDTVLGVRGVRAHILGKTLSSLEAVANTWLQRIAGPGLTLSLKPYSEKKSGGVTDAISLEVVGAGGGYGYKAASGGERRRLDIALLLALAEVAQAAHGKGEGSTLFVDEAFDALDPPGIEAVAKAIQELAKTRCVVVITHDADLARELNACRRIHVENGKVV